MNILDQFRDCDEEGSFGDFPTIKIPKTRSARKPITLIAPPSKPAKDVEDIEEDLELPPNGAPLKLSTQREPPKTPASQQTHDFDAEWAEGSLGIRNGGTATTGDQIQVLPSQPSAQVRQAASVPKAKMRA